LVINGVAQNRAEKVRLQPMTRCGQLSIINSQE